MPQTVILPQWRFVLSFFNNSTFNICFSYSRHSSPKVRNRRYRKNHSQCKASLLKNTLPAWLLPLFYIFWSSVDDIGIWHSMQYTVCSIQCTVYNVQYTICSIKCLLYTVCNIHCTMYSMQYTAFSIQYITDSMQYIIYSI